MKSLYVAALPLLFLLVLSSRTPQAASPLSAQPVAISNRDRSPIDLALIPGTTRLITVNQTSDSVSLADYATGKVLSEVPVGRRPFCVGVTGNGRYAVVSNTWSDTVTILALSGNALKPVQTVTVGDEPRGVAVSRDGTTAYIALGGADAVAVVDLPGGAIRAKWSVGLEPWHLALTPDGSRLAVGNTRGRTVTVLNMATGNEAHSVRVLGRNLRRLVVSADGAWAYLPAISERGQGVTRENIDRGWIVGNRLTRVPLTNAGPREAITLDLRGKGAADVEGAAIRPDGKQIALTAGGTHELLLLRLPDLPFVAYGGPGDHMEPELREDRQRFRRLELGGRPVGITYTPDGKQLLVANYLLNAVQVVDTATATVLRTIDLGGPETPSLARRGEAIFLDAYRSFGAWYSCYSCHTEGHTNGGNFDTLNDGSLGRPKKTLSLRGSAETAPYTWHGWQKEFDTAVGESLRKTMQGPEPTDEEVQAVAAYIRTLTNPPSPFRNADGSLTAAAQRGEKVFADKGCVSCHAAPAFTSNQVVTVGLESPEDAYKGFNPPSLRGVYSRAPYLHDGRAKTLESVLTEHHRPSHLSGRPDCTPTELADLIAYVKSL